MTTVVHLRGAGEEGVGEDVTYSAEDHPPPADLPLTGSHALDSFSELVDRLALFVREPEMSAFLDYRRWAFESAALDLALRQAGRSLAEAVGREPRPVTFVASKRLVDPQSADQLRPWLEMYPTLRFKLDPMSTWDDGLVAELAATRRGRLRRPQGPVRGDCRRPAARPGSLPTRPRCVSGGLGRRPGCHRRDASDPGPACRADHLGRADPLRRGHRGPALAASHDQHQAVTVRERSSPLRRLRLLRGEGHRRLTAVASWSSARDADRSSTSLRCSIPTRRTTSRPEATTPASRCRGFPTSPLEPRIAETGFRWDA